MTSGRLSAFYRRGNEVTETTDRSLIEDAIGDRDGLVWVDILVRSEEDTEILRNVFDFHPLTIEDVLSRHVDPAKVDDYGDYLFVVVTALTEYKEDEELEPVEVDFYLGRNYVVSCHREPHKALDEFGERCRRNPLVLKHRADWLLHGLLDGLVDEFLPIVDKVDNTIDELEVAVLRRPTTQLLRRVLIVKRNTQRLRRAIVPQRDNLNRFSRGEFPKLVQDDALIYFRDVYDHLVRVEYLVEAVRDLADSALNTYLSVVSNRLNEVMKVLTAAATVFLPLTLISGIYGMNFEDNQFPGFDDAWGFAAVTGFMVALAIGLLAFFRWRNWI